jgi:hypothetical protein
MLQCFASICHKRVTVNMTQMTIAETVPPQLSFDGRSAGIACALEETSQALADFAVGSSDKLAVTI